MNQPTKKQNISLLLLTKNEEGRLKNNFKWLDKCPRINEIIVIDDQSTDNTKKIVKSLANKNRQVKIFNRGLDSDFSAQRQFGLKKTKNNWILWLDADEQPSNDLIDFLNNVTLNPGYAFSFRRQDIFLDHSLKYGETAHLHFTRLFNKNNGKFSGKVHEIWQTQACIIKTNITLTHQPHQNLSSLLKKINFYTDIRARELFEKQTPTNIFQIIFYPVAKFFKNYILLLGFLDSTPGIVLALSMSLHSFLVRAKLWHLYQK